MSKNFFEEIVEWWAIYHKLDHRKVDFDLSLTTALKELEVIRKNEKVIAKRIISDWYQDSEETYLSTGDLDIEGPDRNYTVLISAYAVITPPGIPIEERAELWKQQNDEMARHCVNVPKWFLIWKGTIFIQLPPHPLINFLKDKPLEKDETDNLALSLLKTLEGLAELSLHPLALSYALRTDSMKVYYCDFGFNLGGPTDIPKARLLSSLENEILPLLPDEFKKSYLSFS